MKVADPHVICLRYFQFSFLLPETSIYQKLSRNSNHGRKGSRVPYSALVYLLGWPLRIVLFLSKKAQSPHDSL